MLMELTEAENFILDGIIDNPATRATTRAWQETFLLQKFATLAEFEDPVAGSSMYLTAQDGDNDPGPYTYVAGTTNAWEATGGSAILVNSNEVEDPNFVTGPGHSATETYYSPDFAVNGSNVSVEIDTDELGVDLGIAAIRSQISAIEDELSEAQEYIYSQDTAYVDVFLTKRSDELGTFTNTIVVFYSNFDPATNIFTTYARLTDAEWNAFTALVADGDTVVGFGPSFNNFIPFQLLSWAPNGHGTVETGSATYQFELKMIETGAAYTGAGAIADATHKTQFESWATSSPGDTGHPGNTLFYYAEQDANIASIGHAIANHLLNVNTIVARETLQAGAEELGSITVGGTDWNILNAEKNTILDHLEVPMTIGSVVEVDSTIPDEDTRIILDTYDAGGGSVGVGQWYWRVQQTNPSPGVAEAPIYNPTTWEDLADRPNDGETDSNLWRQLICESETVDLAKFNVIRAGVGQVASGATTVDDADLGDFFVAGYDSDTGEVDLNNWAVFRAITNPTGTTNNDVRFRIHSVTSSAGVPPDGAGAQLVISHLSDTVTTTTTNAPMRDGDPSFQENLNITGDLIVNGTVAGLEGETVQVWPTAYTEDFTTRIGSYYEFNDRVWRTTEAIAVTSLATLTGSNPATDGPWELITKDLNVIAGTGITIATDAMTNGLSVTTVSSDTVLNRAEVTVPTERDRILRTGEVQNLDTFIADGIARGLNLVIPYDAGTTPADGNLAWVDNELGPFTATTSFDDLTHIRVLTTDPDANLYLTLLREPFIAIWPDADGTPDVTNWAVLQPTGTFDNTNGFSTVVNAITRQLAVTALAGEFNGEIQTNNVRLIHDNAGFIAENIIRFIEPTFNTVTGVNDLLLNGGGVFDLEETGIITVSELDNDGDPVALGNTNTQFTREGTGNQTHTVHHQPMDSMAYLALQFNSVFAGVRGQVTDPVTPQNAAITDNTRDVDLHVYIEYLSTFNGEAQNVTFVDRVRLSDGETQTRMYDSAAPAAFSPGGTIINQR